jgi:hypothetical protein
LVRISSITGIIWSLCLLPTTALAATPEPISSAFGSIGGVYFGSIKLSEICGEFPALKAESEATSRQYLASNAKLFERIKKVTLTSVARDYGTASSNELDAGMSLLYRNVRDDKHPELRAVAKSEDACKAALANLRRGYGDIQTKLPEAVSLLLALDQAASYTSADTGTPPSPNGTVFRGLKWGMTKTKVKQSLADLKFSEEEYGILCSLFRGPGVECGNELKADDYKIGDNKYSVSMYFTAYDKLAEITLSQNGLSKAEARDTGARVHVQRAVLREYEHLRAMLESKYGKLSRPATPSEQPSPYCEIFRIKDKFDTADTLITISASSDQCHSASSVSVVYKPTKAQKEKPSAGVDKL